MVVKRAGSLVAVEQSGAGIGAAGPEGTCFPASPSSSCARAPNRAESLASGTSSAGGRSSARAAAALPAAAERVEGAVMRDCGGRLAMPGHVHDAIAARKQRVDDLRGRRGLQQRHEVDDEPSEIGNVQVIASEDGVLTGAADPNRDGQAVGFDRAPGRGSDD